jgi:hypothetical protein
LAIHLNNPADRPFSEIQFVGLAIKRGNPFVHVGFLYRNEADEILLSDLAFHRVFRGGETPDTSYFWLDSDFNEVVQEQIAAFLLHVAEENAAGDIPYSFLNRGKRIDASGKYVPSGVGTGLTCATYILSVFEALELAPIDLGSWPVGRPEDIAWGEQILAALVGHATDEHIDAQRAELPNVVRYRPEEVGTAFSIFTSQPLTFPQVEPDSIGLLAQLPPAESSNHDGQ